MIALRGTAGLCDWAAEYKQWWCWPTVKSREADTTAIVERVNTAVSEVETRLSRTLPAPLLVGYSNGGYFTSLLMEPERLARKLVDAVMERLGARTRTCQGACDGRTRRPRGTRGPRSAGGRGR